jgi:hypothetical protein
MKKIIALIIIISSFNVLSAEKISKDDFLKLYDKNKIKFEIMPLMKQIIQGQIMKISELSMDDVGKVDLATLSQIESKMLKEYERSYRFFKPEMLNVRYIDDSGYRYSFFFEFNSSRKCKFRADTLDMSCGNPVCSADTNPANNSNADMMGTIIPDSYCEKAYNIKINNK